METHLCMLHGWALNGDIFSTFKTMLPENWHISTPHLLGHGGDVNDFRIAAVVDKLAADWHKPVFLLGWSLGGLVALHAAARYPEKVRGLILCNTFARFQAASDYPEGVNPAVLQRMVAFFQQDYAQSVRQFLELQLLHNPHRQTMLNALLPEIAQHGTPHALQSALAEVEQADIRAQLPQLNTPTLLLYGGKDAITPPRMGEYLAKHLPQAQLHIAPKAAHAPFLSDADWCVSQIVNWVKCVA